MTDARLQRLVRELLASDATIRPLEKEVTALVEALLASDPADELTVSFKTALREELHAHAASLMETPVKRFWRSIPVLLGTTATLTAALVIAMPIARDAIRRVREPMPVPSVMDMDGGTNLDMYTAPYGTDGTQIPAGRGGGLPEAVQQEDGTSNAAEKSVTAPAPVLLDEQGKRQLKDNVDSGTPEPPVAPMQAEPASNTMMMEMRAMPAPPKLLLPPELGLPGDLRSKAMMRDPVRGDREITVYAIPSIDEVRAAVLGQIMARQPEGTQPETISVGMPTGTLQDYAFDSLPGAVHVKVWIFTDITIDGKNWPDAKRTPVIVPLELPTYE